MDHPRNPPCGPPSQLVSFTPCGGNIQRIAVEHRCTEFAVLLAAYGVLLGRQCHQQELVIGIPVSQRQDPPQKNAFLCWAVGLLVLMVVESNCGMRAFLYADVVFLGEPSPYFRERPRG